MTSITILAAIFMILFGVFLALLFARDVTRADDPNPAAYIATLLVAGGFILLVGTVASGLFS